MPSVPPIPDNLATWLHHDDEQHLLHVDLVGADAATRKQLWQWLHPQLVAADAAKELIGNNKRASACRTSYLATVSGTVVAVYPS